MFGTTSNDPKEEKPKGGTPGLSPVPSADPKPEVPVTAVHEEVEYTFKPSGKDVVKDKIEYDRGPTKSFLEIIVGIIMFPIWLFKWILDLILRLFTFFQKACLTFVFLIVVLALIIVVVALYKPPVIWNPIKTYLNDDLQVVDVEDVDLSQLYLRLSTEGSGTGMSVINNSELTALIRDFTLLQDTLRVESKNSGMIFYMNTDTLERPLWFFVETTKENDKMVVKRAGFGKFDTPASISGFLNDTVGLVFSVVEQQVTAENHLTFFNTIINETKLGPEITLEGVEMKEGSVELYFNIIDQTMLEEPLPNEPLVE